MMIVQLAVTRLGRMQNQNCQLQAPVQVSLCHRIAHEMQLFLLSFLLQLRTLEVRHIWLSLNDPEMDIPRQRIGPLGRGDSKLTVRCSSSFM